MGHVRTKIEDAGDIGKRDGQCAPPATRNRLCRGNALLLRRGGNIGVQPFQLSFGPLREEALEKFWLFQDQSGQIWAVSRRSSNY